MRTVFPGSHNKINGIFGISMIKSTGKDAETKAFQTFVGIDAPYSTVGDHHSDLSKKRPK